ncbi:RNA 2',3'-cyclic phosphodiesterase [Actinomadura kijaniata]|uniref:RNA 2',3'-cyclic phosphodiesterase n=1 Tax=Actinomadura namibiensis TaxID=182080 RepID=A0A7W3M0E4_ACTNM|nr:RNA 2',3'-cyclic phosphodiesterase [Actinomadura namibiensis]MBA8957562.1 2'-5' RNA ligase [Actinomadura namibiensis]
MRLFAAILPPPDVLDELCAFIAPYQAEWPDLRWTDRELLHVTLTFYGEVDDRTLERLLPRLERAVARHGPLNLSLAGAGAFPGNGAHARVLWTGLYGDRRDLARLSAATTAAGRRVGAPGTPPDAPARVYRPHLTLARTRRPVDVRPIIEPMSAFAGSPWTATEVHLMQSRFAARDRRQPLYESLKSWPLT